MFGMSFALFMERERAAHSPMKGGEKMEPIPRDYGERCQVDVFEGLIMLPSGNAKSTKIKA
mgnify:FL=1